MCICNYEAKSDTEAVFCIPGAYAGLLPEINFKSYHVSCVSNNPSTFFDIINKKVHKNGLPKKVSDFWCNMAVTIGL